MSNTQTTVRSPSYPNMSLSDALIAVQKIESEYRSSSVDREHAAQLIGYSSLSGPAAKALAALAHYGLVERAGKGELRVTDLAIQIIHPNNGSERTEGIHAAALAPRLFAELNLRWPNMIPPLDGVMTYLRRQGFNESAIKPAASAYLETLIFLKEEGVSESHGNAPEMDANSPHPDGDADVSKFGGAQVGDTVQWESNGILQFETPLRVWHVTDDGNWVAVEGSNTGIPMQEVIVEKKAAPEPPVFHRPAAPAGAELKADEIEWMRNRVGHDTNVRLIVQGEMGPKEIGKLIKLLEAQKLVLEDD